MVLQGGSQWIHLDEINVLELGEVVWAKMGRRYPWWPAQVPSGVYAAAVSSPAGDARDWRGSRIRPPGDRAGYDGRIPWCRGL